MIKFDIYTEVLDGNSKALTGQAEDLHCLEKNWGKVSLGKKGTIPVGKKALYNKRIAEYKSGKSLFFMKDGTLHEIEQTRFRELLFEKMLVCPYCGKIGFIKRASRVENSNAECFSFELDHFLPKAQFPVFARSVYNLIPVCKICNLFIKERKPYESGWYFHPYIGGIEIAMNSSGNISHLTPITPEKTFHSVYEFGFPKYIKIKNLRSTKLPLWHLRPGESSLFDAHKKYFLLDELYRFSSDTVSDYRLFINGKNILRSYGKLIVKDQVFGGWYPKRTKDILKYTNGKMKLDLMKSL